MNIPQVVFKKNMLNFTCSHGKLDNWGADIHIFVFTYHKNNQF